MTTTPTGRRQTVEGRDSVAFDRTFHAGIDDVWAAITESDRLARWIGSWTGDPATGSVHFTMLFEGDHPGDTMTIHECVPPRRLVASSPAPEGEGDWRYTLTLSEDAGVTTLTFSQNVETMAGGVGPGWDYYLDRLVAAETGGDPSAIDFDDYYPVHEPHYVALFS